MFLTLNLALQVPPTAPAIQYAFIWLTMSVVTTFLIENNLNRPCSTRDYLLSFFLWPLLLFLFCLAVLFDAIGRLRVWLCKKTYGGRFSWLFCRRR